MRPNTKFCVLGGAVAALALAAQSANAGNVSVHTTMPKVNIRLPPPKVGGSAVLPRAGNEVLVGFEHGDTKQPYVLGTVNNSISPAVRTKGTLHR